MASSRIDDFEQNFVRKSKGAAAQESGKNGEKVLNTIRVLYERSVNNDKDRCRLLPSEEKKQDELLLEQKAIQLDSGKNSFIKNGDKLIQVREQSSRKAKKPNKPVIRIGIEKVSESIPQILEMGLANCLEHMNAIRLKDKALMILK